MGDLVPYERLLDKKISRDARKEAEQIFKLVKGDFDIYPTNEQVKMFVGGFIEL
jgi:hypothetical protein